MDYHVEFRKWWRIIKKNGFIDSMKRNNWDIDDICFEVGEQAFFAGIRLKEQEPACCDMWRHKSRIEYITNDLGIIKITFCPECGKKL